MLWLLNATDWWWHWPPRSRRRGHPRRPLLSARTGKREIDHILEDQAGLDPRPLRRRLVHDWGPAPWATVAAVLAYGVVFWFGIYYINRLIAQGPQEPAATENGHFSRRPFSAAHR